MREAEAQQETPRPFVRTGLTAFPPPPTWNRGNAIYRQLTVLPEKEIDSTQNVQQSAQVCRNVWAGLPMLFSID